MVPSRITNSTPDCGVNVAGRSGVASSNVVVGFGLPLWPVGIVLERKVVWASFSRRRAGEWRWNRGPIAEVDRDLGRRQEWRLPCSRRAIQAPNSDPSVVRVARAGRAKCGTCPASSQGASTYVMPCLRSCQRCRYRQTSATLAVR